MMLRLSEPKFRRLDGFFETCPEKFFEPKETRSQFFVKFLHFYNKILTKILL
jgi:hypothetical protein